MRDVRLICSAIKFLSILNCTIEKRVNDHGHARIEGYIRQDDDSAALLLNCAEEKFVTIEIESEQSEKVVLFTGIVESFYINVTADLKKATITLVGSTKLLETIEYTRTYQDKTMTYDQLIDSVEKKYHAAKHLMHHGGDKPIGTLIVQYKETDWVFVKRLASHFNTCIIPHYKQAGIKYHIGLPLSASEKEVQGVSYSIHNHIGEYLYKRDNQVNVIEKDAYYYEIECREAFDLGDSVRFRNQSLYIYSVKSRYVGGELLHTYQLKYSGGFQFTKEYNNKLIGASLDATILSVTNDTVKVCVSVDGTQNKSTAKWFPYSTVYSSPDGSGWYAMPEENDSVRLYFPNEKEEEGYIISSVNLEVSGASSKKSGGAPPRSNPDNKSISTKYDKQIELTPSTIIITNNKGMTVKLDDEEGISIISDKDVLIQSDETLSIKSVNESMSVEAIESIELVQGDTKVTMNEDVRIEGAKLYVQ